MKELRGKRLRLIISEVQKGDVGAIKQLLDNYSPLIYKICQTLHDRYGGLVPMPELVENARHLLLSLTILEYKLNGKARYPHFIKTHLNARLTQAYRPVVAYRQRIVPLKDNKYLCPSDYEQIFKREREKVYEALSQWMRINLNDREMDIIRQHIWGNIPRAQLAKKYGVHVIRMKQIHRRCMAKIRKYLDKIGIRSIRDI